jgi:hypothetical protein
MEFARRLVDGSADVLALSLDQKVFHLPYFHPRSNDY